MTNIKSEIAKLQREIDDRKTALRAILERENEAAKALVAETEEALAVLGGKPSFEARAIAAMDAALTGASRRKPALGRPPGGKCTDAVVAALGRLGPMSARDAGIVARVKRSTAANVCAKLTKKGEMRVKEVVSTNGGKRSHAVYELTAKVV